jgi:hypothetical protein
MRLSLWPVGLGLGLVACANPSTQVRARAARDFGCEEHATRIVDSEVGVYRIEGCGFAATYQCSDANGIATDCQQVYLTKVGEPEAPSKSEPGPNLAKTE